jgi:O-antigen/teichoic acid export membrane protein
VAWWHPSFDAVIGSYSAASFVALVAFGDLGVRRPATSDHAELRATWGPVAAANVAGYALNNGDQYVLAGLRGPATVGVYALGYQLGGGIVGVLTTPVAGAFAPRIVKEWNDPDAGPRQSARSAALAAGAIVGLAMLTVPVLVVGAWLHVTRLVVHDRHLVPVAAIVALATGVHVASSVAYSSILIAAGRAATVSRISWVTVLVSAIAVPVLTATIGIVGTALATLVGYGLMTVFYYVSTRRLVRQQA